MNNQIKKRNKPFEIPDKIRIKINTQHLRCFFHGWIFYIITGRSSVLLAVPEFSVYPTCRVRSTAQEYYCHLERISISKSINGDYEKKVTSTETAKKPLYNPPRVWIRHERAEPLLSGTSSSSTSMIIRTGRSRHLTTNEVIYKSNIETTSCNILGKENGVRRMYESRGQR